MTGLRSPVTGRELRADTPHSLSDGDERWPVVDGIPFLRAGRDELAREALDRLDGKDEGAALAVLLTDQDDWWPGGPADPEAIGELVRRVGELTLRDAMDRLGWGPVGTYFAHRWSDPTFVAGLALAEAHWRDPHTAFELCCGIGHHLRELARRGVRVAGGDVVFAKLWLARRFVVPQAELICFDAAYRWPTEGRTADLVLCQDAFYFLRPKVPIAERLREAAGPDGTVAIGHVHNRDWPNHSAGEAVTADELLALFPGAIVYDDDELTRAAIDARAPATKPPDALRDAEAFSLVAGAVGPPRPIDGLLSCPPEGTTLRRNPLYGDDGSLRFPSARYAAEYGPRATYGARSDCPPVAVCERDTLSWVRRRELVDLPDRW